MDTTKRVEKLREIMADKGIDLSVITNFENQFYFSGLKAITYSRPIVLAVNDNSLSLIVPSLEETHAKTVTKADKLYVYHETFMEDGNGGSHIEYLKSLISSYPQGTKVGVEFSSLPLQLGNIMRDAGLELVNLDAEIAKMRYIKDQDEIDLITESGRLVSLALKTSLENARAGITEIELDQFGNHALFTEVAQQHPDSTLDFFVMSPSGLKRSILPHVFSNTRKLEQNDIVIHSRQVGLNGYRAECERTFFVGEPTEKQKDYFKIASEAQLAALDVIKAGVTAKEVNEVARQIFKKADVEQYSIHRTGHGIGIGLHEEPSLRYDNDLILQEGMVYCVEPGLYVPGIGGFRHSDTVVLTKKGSQLITHHPKELEALTL
ncbi:Xaa-Pro dipeptidase [Scopulibacillus darangshiensis]|uniref:Xaa-Pro dipeptidase n=1 Tax=Scopulibacillus darangshiensis TaxID=442528 RepID=A0A4R2NVK8_9BACL|nr:Xaa-Pro peptidase family protein [Scopulibacillus darangshiensis]TCP25604.1 Xaa-Pro dipeptidase [Scopulibacillus darangshiensis]